MTMLQAVAPARAIADAGAYQSTSEGADIGADAVPLALPAALPVWGTRLVITASVFNLLLCYINTRHWLTIGNTAVIVVEIAILLAGLLMIRHHLTIRVIQLSILVSLYLLGVKLINPGLDLKILHDIAIMYIFYKLGTLVSVESANRTLWTVMLIVLAVGFFELLQPDLFGNIFDVWSYYVNKGVIDQSTVNYSHSNLFISGNRGGWASRTFFPGIFGSHRVSSVFLEPDSLGNFSVVAFAWCLSTSVGSRRNRAILLFLAAFCFVLADSRFASICCLIMLVLRVGFFTRSKLLVFLIPVAVMMALTVTGSLRELPNTVPAIVNDDFTGRLLFSGRLLNYWNLPQWLGMAASQVYTADTGYAYFINNLGLPLSLLLLGLFAAHANQTREGVAMKLMMSVYFATSLCVGASVFTIKTAALLWFLYGATNAVAALRALPAAAKTAPAGAAPQMLPSGIG